MLGSWFWLPVVKQLHLDASRRVWRIQADRVLCSLAFAAFVNAFSSSSFNRTNSKESENVTLPKNKNRTGNQPQPREQSERTPAKLVRAPVPSLIEGTKTEIVYYKPEEDQDIPKNRFTRWLYYRAQIILGVLTLAVVVFYAVQWWEYRNTRELENRAYVAVKEVVLEPDPKTPGLGTLKVKYINTGRTPGQNGQIVYDGEVRETAIPEDAGFSPADHPASKAMLAPMIEVENGIGIISLQPDPNATVSPTTQTQTAPKHGVPAPSLTPASVPDATPNPDSKRRYYAWGIITYQDIFGSVHHTKFCFFNRPGTQGWHFCETYNSID